MMQLPASRRNLPSWFVLVLAVSVASPRATVAQSDKIRFRVDSEDGQLTVPQLVAKHGYPVEEHPVTTDDGYRLMLHRLRSNRPNALVVLLMHGLLCSSADWLLIGPGNALAYLLADRGYDVWLGNARGNRYSRQHASISPAAKSFWKFSWHEIGYYDIPAMIDYILESTGHDQLHYVGHSQGTTGFFVMASTRPEYNAKVIQMQALAPVAYMEHMKSPLLLMMTKFLNTLDTLLAMFGVGEFLPNNPILHQIAKYICPTSTVNNMCVHLLFLLAGYNPSQMDPTLVPILLGHTPAGSATKQLVHYAQEVHSRRFRMYDHGPVKNYLNYRSLTPPEYDLSKVTAPVVLYYGLNDLLAAPEDVQRLAARLPNLQHNVRVNHTLFNHLDFLIANDVRRLLYEEVIERIAATEESD
ncbi:lipase 1 [Anopheles ziemanni]|uniref:lipase 1 n=1 Tax=Anopheles coustani TaxID=139045 RepID=UPI00265B0460|nr:lipase 1 [Anopheles coustani]XP_058169741.1 lipase 1 [Anopheles ziemanni]